MYTIDLQETVRYAYFHTGQSIREISKVYNLDRKTVRRMLGDSRPSQYRLSARRPRRILGPYIDIIRAIRVAQAGSVSIAEIYRVLQSEHGFTGSYSSVREFIRADREVALSPTGFSCSKGRKATRSGAAVPGRRTTVGD
jgi:transposase